VLDELGAGLPDEVCDAAPPARRARRRMGSSRLSPTAARSDRRMTVLEIVTGGRRTAALVFFAVHPTVLEASTPLYSFRFHGARAR